MIRLSRAQSDRILAEAASAFPEECCGLLVGREDDGIAMVTRVVPSPNVATGDRTKRFEVSPQIRFDLMRELRGGNEEIVGHYHSHPDHPPVPSDHDAGQAWEPDLIWLIAGRDADRQDTVKAWRFRPEAGGFGEIPLEVVP